MGQVERAWRYLRLGVVLTVASCTAAHVRGPVSRTLGGDIYFTNNTPRDLATFPVELYTPDQKRRVAGTTASAKGEFTLTGIEPGNYLLRVAWATNHCTLWYRVDLTAGSRSGIVILMDVDCAHGNGEVLDPYRS
jgi:hypothetical protein